MTDMSKVGRKSKRKGSSFERRIAKVISPWFGEEIIRTPASGGMRSITRSDLTTRNPDYFPFVIECKYREDINFESIIKYPKVIIDSWIELKEKANTEYWKPPELKGNLKFPKVPILILTINYCPNYIILQEYIIINLSRSVETLKKESFVRIHVSELNENIVIFVLEKFLELISKDNFLYAMSCMEKSE